MDEGLVWVEGDPEGVVELEIRVLVVRKPDGDHSAAWSMRVGEQVSLAAISLAHLYLHKLAQTLLEMEAEIQPEFRIGEEDGG